MVKQTETVKTLAPEDIRVGQYVMELRMIVEFPRIPCDGDEWKSIRTVRLALTPWCTGEPMRVRALCLPFVRVKYANGRHGTVDVRRWELAAVTDAYGEAIFARAKRKRRKKKRRKRREKKRLDV